MKVNYEKWKELRELNDALYDVLTALSNNGDVISEGEAEHSPADIRLAKMRILQDQDLVSKIAKLIQEANLELIEE